MPNNNSAAHLDQIDQIRSAMATFGKYFIYLVFNYASFPFLFQ